jgi:hypothetical protein
MLLAMDTTRMKTVQQQQQQVEDEEDVFNVA